MYGIKAVRIDILDLTLNLNFHLDLFPPPPTFLFLTLWLQHETLSPPFRYIRVRTVEHVIQQLENISPPQTVSSLRRLFLRRGSTRPHFCTIRGDDYLLAC